MTALLDLGGGLLAAIASFLCVASAGRFANCIRDGAARAAVQGAPARDNRLRRVFWCLPRATLPFRWSSRATMLVDGDKQFLSVWDQIVERCARRGGGAPWLKLIFVNCNAIRDWHLVFLGQVCVSLSLHHCWYISKVGPLGQVRELEMSGCPLVKNIEGLGGHRQARVSLADLSIASAWPVRSVPCVTIARCGGLLDLEGFGGVPGQRLTFADLPIKGFGALEGRALGSVHVTSCPAIESAAGLERCDEVSLLHMKNLRDVDALRDASMVTIVSCPELRELWRRAGRGQRVALYNLPIGDVDVLAGASSLELSACDWVQYVGALADVPQLRVRNCYWLTDRWRGVAFSPAEAVQLSEKKRVAGHGCATVGKKRVAGRGVLTIGPTSMAGTGGRARSAARPGLSSRAGTGCRRPRARRRW